MSKGFCSRTDVGETSLTRLTSISKSCSEIVGWGPITPINDRWLSDGDLTWLKEGVPGRDWINSGDCGREGIAVMVRFM